MAGGAIQRQLANEEAVLQLVQPDLLRGRQNAHGNGQVIGRPLFAQVGRGQVHGNTLVGRKIQPTVFDGGVHPVAAFAHGGVGQAHQGEVGVATDNVYFNLYQVGLQTDNRTANDFGQHEGPS